MDEIQRALSDPETMEKVTRLAQQLMGGETPPAESPVTAGLGSLLQGMKPGQGGHPLAAALGAHLDEGRRRRLERALSAAGALRLSGALFGRDGHGL